MIRQATIADKPFHARIFRVYLEYLREKEAWSQEQIDNFLIEIGVEKARLMSDSSWFDIDFADKFYDELCVRTGNKNLAFQAGFYIRQNALSRTIYQILKSLLSLAKIYQLISKITPHFTKAAILKVKSIQGTQAILESIPVEGYIERPYMCQNRMGMLSAVPQVFNLPPAEVSHPECLHKGGKKCVYLVRWKENSLVPLVVGFSVSAVGIFFLFSINYTAGQSLLVTVVYSAIMISCGLFVKLRGQQEELKIQHQVLDQAVEQNQKQGLELELVSSIAKLTHAQTSPLEIAALIVKNVCHLLNYDRAMLLMVVPDRNILKVVAHHGFSNHMQELLEESEFNIRADNNSGFFIQVLNTKKPMLIENVIAALSSLSTRSQKFAKMLGSTSFVAVPLTDAQQNVVGVLAVDNIDPSKLLTINDQDLLMTLSDHLGIALHNAKMLQQMEENLELSRSHSKLQQYLRQTFQRFVPTDLANEILQQNIDGSGDLRSRVKKKPAAILFCDIFNYSVLSDQMNSENIVELLNTVFARLAPLVDKHHGYIDKFTGDGFIAVFERSEEACRDACRAAIGMMHAMLSVNADLKKKSYPSIEIGVGINYGEVILGNLGSVDRVNFTVIGEAVNLAARLESYTRKVGPNSICCSTVVRARAGEVFEWNPLGPVALKGYEDPQEIHQLKVSAPSGSQDSLDNPFRRRG